jgi:DNA-binding response OmpR family regulator
MPAKLLIISSKNSSQDHWLIILKSILASIGSVDIIEEQEIKKMPENYDLVVIDAGLNHDVCGTINKYTTSENTRILVIAASLNWLSARQFFKAGASDCIPKNLTEAEFRKKIDSLLR